MAPSPGKKKRGLPTCFHMPLVSPLLLVLYSQLMSSVDSPLAAAYSYTARRGISRNEKFNARQWAELRRPVCTPHARGQTIHKGYACCKPAQPAP